MTAQLDESQSNNADSVAYFIICLKNEDKEVRKEAVDALEDLGDKAAVVPLLQTLDDESDEVRWYAVSALGHLGDAQAIEPLLKILNDTTDNDSVRYWAAIALSNLAKPNESGYNKIVDSLLKNISDSEWRVRSGAIEALSKLREKRGLAAIINCLNDTDQRVRETAAESLVEFNDEAAVKALIDFLLTEKNKNAIFYAVETLGVIGNNTALPVLTSFQSDTSEDWLGRKISDAATAAIQKICQRENCL